MVVGERVKNADQLPSSKLLRCALGKIEFAALDHIASQLGIRAAAVAVRYAITQQTAWAEANGTPYTPKGKKADREEAAESIIDRRLEDADPSEMSRVRDSVLVPQDEGLTQWSFWATPEQREQLKELGKAWQLDKQAEAIRAAIRLQAAATGFKPVGGWPGLLASTK